MPTPKPKGSKKTTKKASTSQCIVFFVKENNDCVIVLRVLQTPILKTCVTAIRLVLSAEKILLAVGATTEVGGEWVPAEWEGPQDPWKRKRPQLL